MFNWFSLVTFGAVLLFCLLAAYVLTRSPRNPISLTAAAAQIAAAAFLLGQGMQANALTEEEWRPWARYLQWGATTGPTLWYWVTLLLLREQKAVVVPRYLRRVGYPLGLLFAMGSIVLTTAIYVGEWLYVWSTPIGWPPERAGYFRYYASPGPLYPGLAALILGASASAAVNVALAWRLAYDEQRRQRFAWLFLSAVLFILGGATLAIATWLSLLAWSFWLSHLLLAVAEVVMALNVASYSLLLQRQVIRTDFLYFLTAISLICVVYGLVFFLVGPGYSFQSLGWLAIILILVIFSHALVDVARRILDRLFFDHGVQQVRSHLTSVVESAARTSDVIDLLEQAKVTVEEAADDHVVRLTEEALRRLNKPAALAKSRLTTVIPRTLVAARGSENGSIVGDTTPLQQAQALREVLAAAIERLKPAGTGGSAGSAGALQYHILREEYLLGKPNKQIMIRHNISEGTFHRNRREAIAILAHELKEQEDLLAQQQGQRTLA